LFPKKNTFFQFSVKKGEKRREENRRQINKQTKEEKKEREDTQTNRQKGCIKTHFFNFLSKRGKEERSVYLEEELLFPKGDKIII
jgi:hypothetical protein